MHKVTLGVVPVQFNDHDGVHIFKPWPWLSPVSLVGFCTINEPRSANESSELLPLVTRQQHTTLGTIEREPSDCDDARRRSFAKPWYVSAPRSSVHLLIVLGVHTYAPSIGLAFGFQRFQQETQNIKQHL